MVGYPWGFQFRCEDFTSCLIKFFTLSLQILETRNPSPPLDLEIPFNDDLSSILTRNYNNNNNNQDNSEQRTNRNNNNDSGNIRKNILINNYNPISDTNLRNSILLKNNRNIIGSTYDNNGGASSSNSGGGGVNNSTSRPSHKTHVEIITKNGATKKPNIIVNSFEPDVTITGNINNNHGDNNFNLNVRNELGEFSAAAGAAMDRKSTCMLYLQADHTFFEKMGSDEASIEAITRHVQRANVIYRTTGELHFCTQCSIFV